MKFPTYKFETKKLDDGFTLIAGCDEVGIAPLAGPVVAAAVILDPQSIGKQRSKNKWWYRVRDSKTVNEKERDELERFICDHCLSNAVSVVSHETIDMINIFHASHQALAEALAMLAVKPEFVFIDGLHKIKKVEIPQVAVVDGDAKILSIAAASIVAKVARDKIMQQLHEAYPMYGLDKHKGYPTPFHKKNLQTFGVSPIHRKVSLLLKSL